TGPPGIHERTIFFRCVLPRKMAGVEQMKFAERQAFVEIFGVNGWYHDVSAAGNDLHGRLYFWQGISQDFKLRRVSLHVANRLGESISIVRSEIVFSSRVAQHITFERLHRALDDRAATDPSIRLEVRRKDPFP